MGRPGAAYCVLTGDAGACLATRSAARAFGPDFLPLRNERYDLVMRRRTANLLAAKAFLDVLQRATPGRKLEVLAGYDTSQTGVAFHWLRAPCKRMAAHVQVFRRRRPD